MRQKFNILMSQKMIFTMSQKTNFLFQKQVMYYVAKSDFFHTRRIILIIIQFWKVFNFLNFLSCNTS